MAAISRSGSKIKDFGPKPEENFWFRFLVSWLAIWDTVTKALYVLFYRPHEVLRQRDRVRARQIKTSDPDNEVIYESPETESDLYDDLLAHKVDTMDKAWKWMVDRYGNKKVLGTRDIIAEESECQPNGKIFKKLNLGDYRWLSYKEADETADYFGKGLRQACGLKAKDRIAVFADTRNEWFLTAQGAFKQNIALATLYTNLGEEAVVHGVNQTKATTIVTTSELLPKFKNIVKHTPTLNTIIVFESQTAYLDERRASEEYGIKVLTFWDVVSAGRKHDTDDEVQPEPPTLMDTAIVMYTSGSTGVPKGVILSHRNMFACLKAIVLTVKIDTDERDTYIAFLPLAHVLELLCESCMALYGVKIGYSTPNTLLDSSTMIKRGAKGDASLLKPTVMAAVPLILDRVYKSINDGVAKKGATFKAIFDFCVKYRQQAEEEGMSTPIMDKLLFQKIRNGFGGRLRFMFSGGAPLSKETHRFVRTVMGCPVLQGYGLTETTACASLTGLDEYDEERVGPPNQFMQLKLINWEEGNYRVTDKPFPRGEIVIGGNAVAEGYFEMPDKTAEEFEDSHGRRWFKTGDVGLVEPNGVFRIIDRKKDLVKLQFGEYVSLGKVESVLKTVPAVENICIYGDAKQSYCVALVSPDAKGIQPLLTKFGKSSEMSLEEMSQDRDLTGAVLRELINHGKQHKLEKFEIPGAVTLVKELWTPDSGLVTAAFKLKRKPIQDLYQKDIDRMYGIK